MKGYPPLLHHSWCTSGIVSNKPELQHLYLRLWSLEAWESQQLILFQWWCSFQQELGWHQCDRHRFQLVTKREGATTHSHDSPSLWAQLPLNQPLNTTDITSAWCGVPTPFPGFCIASAQLLFRFHCISLLPLSNFPKLLSFRGLALPTLGSPSCHSSQTQVTPVARRNWLVLCPGKLFSASLHKQPLLILHLAAPLGY